MRGGPRRVLHLADEREEIRSGRAGDPAMQALNAKIRRFVNQYVRNSPDIAAQMGGVQGVAAAMEGSSTTTLGNSDPLHPGSGENLVRVTGGSGTKVFKILWTMDASGVMTVTQSIQQTN